jgi:hypothetical protein
MKKSTLPPKVREGLEDMCAFRFQQILRITPTLIPSINVDEYKDRYLVFDAVITELRDGSSAQRLAARCLIYIKQHVNLLRHQQQGKGLSNQNCELALDNITDLLQALTDLQAENCFVIVKDMAVDYYQICAEHDVRLPNIRPPLVDILGFERLPEPVTTSPKGRTVIWYKKTRLEILFQTWISRYFS